MQKREMTTLVDQQITRMLEVLADGLPVECVLAGSWAAVSRAMITAWGAETTAQQHDNMAATIRGHIEAGKNPLATVAPAGRA